jgi:hypothetical protein
LALNAGECSFVAKGDRSIVVSVRERIGIGVAIAVVIGLDRSTRMDIIESDQLLLLVAAAIGIPLLLRGLVIAIRTGKVREQLLELDALKRSVQTVQSNLTEIVRIADRTFAGLRELSGFGLHFRQIKREQLRLSEKLKMISSAMETLEGLPQLRHEIRGQNEKIEEIVEASRSLQEWRSRVTAVCSDAGHLFESEPIRELIDRFGPQPTSYTAEPPGRSGRKNKAQPEKSSPPTSQMVVRPVKSLP